MINFLFFKLIEFLFRVIVASLRIHIYHHLNDFNVNNLLSIFCLMLCILKVEDKKIIDENYNIIDPKKMGAS